jgi:hypothetical protein
MARMSWNDFVAKHEQGVCVIFAFTAKDSKSLDLDGKKLPSGYGALTAVLEKIFTSDWTARRSGSAAQIVLVSESDLGQLKQRFRVGTTNIIRPPKPCGSAFQAIFGPEEYVRIATALGYKLPRRK